MSLVALILVVMALEWGLHYFPWRLIFKRQLPRIPSYTLGVLAIFIPFSIWLCDHNYQQVLATLWIAIGSAGASVAFWYFIDWLLDKVNAANESQEREREAVSRLEERNA